MKLDTNVISFDLNIINNVHKNIESGVTYITFNVNFDADKL